MEVKARIVNVRDEVFYIPDEHKADLKKDIQINYPEGGDIDYRWLQKWAKCKGLPLPLAELRDD